MTYIAAVRLYVKPSVITRLALGRLLSDVGVGEYILASLQRHCCRLSATV